MKTLSLITVCMIIVITAFAQPSFKIAGQINAKAPGLRRGLGGMSIFRLRFALAQRASFP